MIYTPGRRFQVSTYSLVGVWFVLDTKSPDCKYTTDNETGEKRLVVTHPVIATALSRAAAREIARIYNHDQGGVDSWRTDCGEQL